MTYEEFIIRNTELKHNIREWEKINKIKEPKNFLRIEKISFEKGLCLLSNGEKIKIADLVKIVVEGKDCVSNPSQLANWNGFKVNKAPDTTPKTTAVPKSKKATFENSNPFSEVEELKKEIENSQEVKKLEMIKELKERTMKRKEYFKAAVQKASEINTKWEEMKPRFLKMKSYVSIPADYPIFKNLNSILKNLDYLRFCDYLRTDEHSLSILYNKEELDDIIKERNIWDLFEEIRTNSCLINSLFLIKMPVYNSEINGLNDEYVLVACDYTDYLVDSGYSLTNFLAINFQTGDLLFCGFPYKGTDCTGTFGIAIKDVMSFIKKKSNKAIEKDLGITYDDILEKDVKTLAKILDYRSLHNLFKNIDYVKNNLFNTDLMDVYGDLNSVYQEIFENTIYQKDLAVIYNLNQVCGYDDGIIALKDGYYMLEKYLAENLKKKIKEQNV